MRKLALILFGIGLLSGGIQGAEPEGKAYLGVSVRDSEPVEDGVMVLSVVPGSPGEEAGLRAGDRIVTVQDGHPCGVECFGARIREAGPGARIVIRFVRNGSPRETEAVLGRAAAVRLPGPGGGIEWSAGKVGRFEAPEVLLRNRLDAILAEVPRAPVPPEIFMSPASRIGLDLIRTTEELRLHLGGSADAGALVGEVKPGSAAEKAGILTGDLLVGVEGQPVRGDDGWVILMNTLSRSSVKVDLLRNRRPLAVTVELPERPAPGPLEAMWPQWSGERSRAIETALQSLDSSLKNEEMSRELRDHLQAVREQLQRALNPPPEQDPAGR